MSRIEELRAQYLHEASLWAFPTTEWEVMTVAIVLALATVRALRLGPEILRRFGMQAKECHRNVGQFLAAHGAPGGRAILGWAKGPRVLTLHSIIEADGRYLCVTPAPDQPPEFDFIPDPALEWRERDGRWHVYRGDVRIGIGLRRFPVSDAAWFGHVVERLRSGMDPNEAIALEDPQIGLVAPHALRRG